jgi:hypothetical protein
MMKDFDPADIILKLIDIFGFLPVCISIALGIMHVLVMFAGAMIQDMKPGFPMLITVDILSVVALLSGYFGNKNKQQRDD